MYSHGHKLLAFLPVEYMYMLNGEYVKNKSLSRVTKLKKHRVIAQVMKLFVDTAVSGIRCSTRE